ncbi:MAG: isoleucine--tRNA ligase [Myxococcota bacterium]
MSRFPELKSPPELEAEVLKFWKDHAIFAKSLEASRERPTFVFYEGPPTANGMPHNGHVLTRVSKDIFPRYRTMRGWHVPRKAGWDTHGLPVEVEVEKLLGIHGREAIEAYGVEPFAEKCIQSVFRYTKEWEEMSDRIGFWLDNDNAYVTYHRSYIESVWWALSKLFEKGLLYQDYKVVWWWPQGGTALSSGEVGEGYRTVDDPSVTVKFAVKGQPGTYLLAWTTTPWTLPSNVALAVRADADYAFVKVGDDVLIVADAVKPEGDVLKVVKGSELVGLAYEPLYAFATPEGGRSYVVVAGEHVEVAQTGIVHTAPAFGEDDFELRKAAGLGFLQLVGPDGKFVRGTGFLEGRFCKEADKDIVRELKERGLVFRSETYRHEYPFCPRADNDPLIQYARPAWFIRTTALKEQALANNAAVSWLPETIRDGRFGDFLRNNVDWALSRERFWGTPLNIWTCGSCDKRVAPASVAEIEARGGELAAGVERDLAVHKPFIDKVTLRCECGGTMTRVPEVIDCWFDSGCMPFAQFGFPHTGREEFDRAFPADFISEAVDQTRGWFYSLLMIGTLVFDDETCRQLGLAPRGFPRPYKHCIVLGHVCDADGKKESKSKGNYTSPDLVLKGSMKVRALPDATLKPGQVGFKAPQVKSLGLDPNERLTAPDGTKLEVVTRPVKGKDAVHLHPDDLARLGEDVELSPPFAPPGADAFRWLFYASNPPWNNTRISLKAILEGQREFLFRLKNCHQFFVLNAGDHTPQKPRGEHLLDRWILHELDQLVASTTRWLDEFRVYEPARAINAFVDGLSNWWLRRSRDRFDGDDAADAKDTLHHVLLTLSKLVAPFVPFMGEAMYRSLRLDGPESVHLCAWPTPEGRADAELAAKMALVRELASLGLAARAEVGVRVRQPLSAAEVVLARAVDLGELAPLLKDELNVREVRFSRDAGRFVTFKVKPDFKALGARLGKDMKAVASALAQLSGDEVHAKLAAGSLVVAGHVLGEGDVLTQVEPKAGFRAAGSADAVVALHTELDEDLREEGLAREVIAKVQGVRKAWGLGYDDRIALAVEGGDRTARMLARFWGEIAGTVGASSGETFEEEAEIVADGETVKLRIARA